MRTLVKQEKQLEFNVFPDAVIEELNNRVENQKTVEDRFPFLRVNCLQEVTFSEGSANQIQSTSISKPNISTIEGLTVEFNKDINRNFEKTYGPRQYVGKTIKGKQTVEINNTRRTPPLTITSFTADYGGTGGFFGKAQLSFTAHSMEQLEFIQPFLLTPGNTIFTEFGYSNTAGDINDKLFSEDTLNKLLEYSGVNADLFSELNNKVFDSNCNYEYFIGQIINFSINPTQTYGFECTVDMFAISQLQHDESNPLPADRESAFLSLIENVINDNFVRDLDNNDVKSNAILFSKYNCSLNTESYFITLNFLEKFLNLFTLNNLNTEFARELLSKNQLINDYTEEQFKQLIKYSDLSEKNELVNLNTAAFNNKFIISKNSDVLIIKNEIPNFTKYLYDEKSRKRYFQNTEKPEQVEDAFTFTNIENDFIVPLDLASLETSVGPGPPSPVGLGTQPLQRTDDNIFGKIFETSIIPRKYDIDKTRGNIGNIYINYAVIKSLLQDKTTTNYDILNKIANIISEASGYVLNLEVIERTVEAEIINKNNEPVNKNVNVLELVDYSIFEYQPKVPYTFKFNNTESIITDYSFELNLPDIEGNAVIAEGLGLSEDSNRATTSRLLFDKNGPIRVRDYFLSAESDEDDDDDNKNQIPDTAIAVNENNNPPIKYTRPPCESYNHFFVPSDREDVPLLQVKPTLFKTAIDNTSDLPAISSSDPVKVDRQPARDEVADGEPFKKNPSSPYNESIGDIGDFKITTSTENKRVNLIEPDNEHHVFAMNKLGLLDPQKSKEAANPILSPELNITFPGIGGITPTQYFDTEYLPEIYSNRGKFIILNVTHTVSPQTWTTQMQSSFRINRQD